LASPLEWGLGHTVRLVPFIQQSIDEGHRVILASDGVSLDFLRFRFPDLPWIQLPFFPVRYSGDGRFFGNMIPQVPGILKAIRNNHIQLREIIKNHQVTEIIGDHRYGMHHRNVHSVFITNQLWLKAPKGWGFAEGLVYILHRLALRKFSEIWISDNAGEPNLSGLLTHPPFLPQKAKYIGPVSRFQKVIPVMPLDAKPFEALALISGPEPQRTLFEELIISRFRKKAKISVLLRGIPPKQPDSSPGIRQDGNILIIDHACDEELAWYISHAAEIICRPGNSTLSDLVCLGKTALLVPTPGQTEQEYVARHLEKQGRFRVCEQGEL